MKICPARRFARPLLIVACLAWLAWAPAQAQPPVTDVRGAPDFASPLARETSVVVSITTTRRAAQGEIGFAPDSFAVPARRPTASRDPWSWPRRAEHERDLASGVVIGSDGEILTNAHAVADVERVIVRLADGRQFTGKVVGIDRTTDVALLKIDARGLPAAAIGSSASLVAGEWVVAIGSPFGLDNSATAGIVSAARRFLPGSAVPLIQTDVAINPGSSGGPLFNLRGEVVGINSMVFSLTGGYMGVSFSVPIDLAIRIADDLRSFGRVTRGQLGAKIQDVTPDLARSFGLPAARGALVLRVVRDSPAERAGLRGGDVVLGIDGRTESGYVQLQQDVAAARPGQSLSLNVWRRGAVQRVVLTVGEAPADLPARAEAAQARRDERLGLSLGELPAARRDRLGVDGGVSVLEVHGAASLGGIQADDLIVAIGDRPVRDIAAFDAALAAAPADRPVALLVLRAGTLAYLAVEQNR
jgi:Do/DeqQ family serine protease